MFSFIFESKKDDITKVSLNLTVSLIWAPATTFATNVAKTFTVSAMFTETEKVLLNVSCAVIVSDTDAKKSLFGNVANGKAAIGAKPNMIN